MTTALLIIDVQQGLCEGEGAAFGDAAEFQHLVGDGAGELA